MEQLLRDLRMAARAIIRKPGVSILGIGSLALAIGFSTAGFSILDGILLRDAPVRAPASLVRIDATTGQHSDGLSWAEYQALLLNAHSFAGIVAEDRRTFMVSLPDRADFPITAQVSDNYFDVLGVRASIGEVFNAGQGHDQTVVLSNHYWKQALDGDPAIIGRVLRVGRGLLRVIGVLPPGFQGDERGVLADLFVPAQTAFSVLGSINPADARSTAFSLLGRLRGGVSLEQARSEADAILRQVEIDGRAPAPERRAALLPFDTSQLSVKLMYLAMLVLLVVIAAANVANLRLVDNESRRREVGIRLALGAGRYALARAHLAEALLLSATGTACGLLIAAWLIRLTPALLYAGDRYLDYGIRLDHRVFAFASGALLLVALISASIPLVDSWKQRVLTALSGARSTRSSRWLAVLVIVQMAVATGFTCSASLLWRSLQNVSAIRPAMNPDQKLLMVRGFWPNAREAATGTEFLADRLAGLPGVEQVAWARRALLSGSGGGASVEVEVRGQPALSFYYNQVSPNYFAATGARILAGRTFLESEGPNSTPVVMVNSTFARQLLSGRQPVGEWVKVNGKDRQIVGIVEDGPTTDLREPPAPYLYIPFAQMPRGELTFFARSAKDPALLAGTLRATIRDAARTFVIVDLTTMAQHMRTARSNDLLAADLTSSLAMLALLLAAAGLFGVSLFAVARRTQEFGVRIAIGATPATLMKQVLGECGRLAVISIPLGMLLAYASRHALESLLYGVAPDDPWMLLGACALVAITACVASLYPAIRAARIDPMAALRHE